MNIKMKSILTSCAALLTLGLVAVPAGLPSAQAATTVTDNEMAFPIPANSFCDASHMMELSLNITNLSNTNAAVTLRLFKADGTELTTTGTAYNGIAANLTPGTSAALNALGTDFYHLTFGGQTANCADRPYAGKLIVNAPGEVDVVATGFVSGSLGNSTIIINGGQTWKVAPSDEEPAYTDAVPPLTANDSAGPIKVSASSLWNNNDYQPWRAFNDTTIDSRDSWGSAESGTQHWLMVDFGAGSAETIRKYSLKSRNDSNNFGNFNIKSWRLEASNDGTNFVTLDTQTNVSNWGNAEKRVYTLTNTTAYRYYRIYTTASYHVSGAANIGEMELLKLVN